ncbi:MAG: S8 family serine peptidase [Chloroflexota bacterium]
MLKPVFACSNRPAHVGRATDSANNRRPSLQDGIFHLYIHWQLATIFLLTITFILYPSSTSASAVTQSPPSRLIIELERPPLLVALEPEVQAAGVKGKLDINTPHAQTYVAALQAEQATFMQTLQTEFPSLSMSRYIDEFGVHQEASYQLVLNGIAVALDGRADHAQQVQLQRQIAKMPGVKAVYPDQLYTTRLYTSTSLIQTLSAWDLSGVDGIDHAGAGVKIASLDGGLHKDAPMFDGSGYTYPAGYEPDGKGETSNNNGKIIVSRTYFRPWDPPTAGDEHPWPGINGTSHGVHTGSIAAGNVITELNYYGYNAGRISGVAPRAYVMSYRLFYNSIHGNGGFYTIEGIAAIEDAVKDGADIINNSWGSGPLSEGGTFSPIDRALINAAKANIFVVMSAGNSGPWLGTADHPSSDYINVAASSTGGTITIGRVAVERTNTVTQTANPPQNISYTQARFGPFITLGQEVAYNLVAAEDVDAENAEACEQFTPGVFNTLSNPITQTAVLVKRGTCFFIEKVYHAQQAGADFVIVYNDRDGDTLMTMSCGSLCDDYNINVSSIFIGENHGKTILALLDADPQLRLRLDTFATQTGQKVDYITNFSSRGPGVGNVLKPDIAAPGLNILAQGFTPNTRGEDRHLFYGQSSGTSMAAPHVAGAAALIKQLHPDWSNAYIKSALMSTAKYIDIFAYNARGDVVPAQPLDMGAGRLDIGAAINPGIILEPPSLSIGKIHLGSARAITVNVTNVAMETETYNIGTRFTGNGFTQTVSLSGVTVTPSVLTLDAGASSVITVTFSTTDGVGLGHNQGYIELGGTRHDGHMPLWAQVIRPVPLADVLIIDNDFSDLSPAHDYRWYYTNALAKLGYTYSVVNVDTFAGLPTTIPDETTLNAFRAVILFTGDNFQPNGTFNTATGLTKGDEARLVEYLNSGGTLIAMGQDLAAALNMNATDPPPARREILYHDRLGANFIQDSVSTAQMPDQRIDTSPSAPRLFENIQLVLSETRRYSATVPLVYRPDDATDFSSGLVQLGIADLSYEVANHRLSYNVGLNNPSRPLTITASHLRINDEIMPLEPFTVPNFITTPLRYSGVVTLTQAQTADLLDNQHTLDLDVLFTLTQTNVITGSDITTTTDNITTTTIVEFPETFSGQITPQPVPTQRFIDELDTRFHDNTVDPTDSPLNPNSHPFNQAILRYPGPNNVYSGTVAIANRKQPILENPGIDYRGRSIYAAFGLEGMSNVMTQTQGVAPTTRAQLLGTFLSWGWSEPLTAVMTDVHKLEGGKARLFTATLTRTQITLVPTDTVSTITPVSYRWDMGDNAGIVGPLTNAQMQYVYANCGNYTVRTEVTDSNGNTAIASQPVEVSTGCDEPSPPLSVLANPTRTTPGSTVTYAILGRNATASAFSGTVVTMTLPVSTTFDSTQSTLGWRKVDTDGSVTRYTISVGGVAPDNMIYAVLAVTIDTEILGSNATNKVIRAPSVLLQANDGIQFEVAASDGAQPSTVQPNDVVVVRTENPRVFLPIVAR